MRYFPLSRQRFEHQFGIRALPDSESIVEATQRYDDEIALKRKLLGEDRANYARELPGSEPIQQEAASVLLSATPFLADNTNSLLGEKIDLVESSPLYSIARHLQEDLIVLGGDPSSGHPVIAGVVCFPSGWSIGDKIGKSISQVHDPVPDYASVMGRSTDRLLEQLKPNRPVWRMNWGVRSSGRLDQSLKRARELEQASAQLTTDNVGGRCHFRVERQTLSRLPETRGILFTIHTHQCPIEQLETWQQRNLLGVLETCPQETLDYKGISPIYYLVVAALRRGISS